MSLFIRTKEDKQEKTVTIQGQSTDPSKLTESLLETARSENDQLAVKKYEDGGMSILGNNTNYDVIPKDDLTSGMTSESI